MPPQKDIIWKMEQHLNLSDKDQLWVGLKDTFHF